MIINDYLTFLEGRKARYLLVGGFNTAAGYTIGVTLYYALSHRFHIITIGFIANILAITISFTTYKLFVFKTKGHWLAEYFRSYLVYGAIALISIFLLWIFVDGLHIPIIFSQGFVIIFTVIFSYLGHSLFTFRR